MVCQHLGFSAVLDTNKNFPPKVGAKTVIVQCTESHRDILSCDMDISPSVALLVQPMFGVECSRIRLVEGEDDNEGDVEVFIDEKWVPVCGDSWTMADGDFICQSLGFPHAFRTSSVVTDESGLTKIDWKNCNETQSNCLSNVSACLTNTKAAVDCR